jgi:hypothetical protein
MKVFYLATRIYKPKLYACMHIVYQYVYYTNFYDFLFSKNWKIPFPITEEDSET